MLKCVTVGSVPFLARALKASASETYHDLIVLRRIEVACLTVMFIDLMMGELLCYDIDTFWVSRSSVCVLFNKHSRSGTVMGTLWTGLR